MPRVGSDRSGCSPLSVRTAGARRPQLPRNRSVSPLAERDVRLRALPPGPIGFSSQSGALGLALLEKASERSLGFSSFISVGNKADVSANDLLEYWEEDPETGLVALYLESFGNPRRFGRTARRVARKKPILAMKSGPLRAGPRGRLAHRGSRRLRGGGRGPVPPGRRAPGHHARGADRRRGAALDTAAAPWTARRPPDECRRPRDPLADACEAAGLSSRSSRPRRRRSSRELLPAEASLANPVDMLGSATEASYEAVVPILLADPQVDALIVLFVPRRLPVPRMSPRGSHEPCRAGLLTSPFGRPDQRRGTAANADSGSALHVSRVGRARLGLAVQRAEWLRRPAGTVPRVDGVDTRAPTGSSKLRSTTRDDAWLGPRRRESFSTLTESRSFPNS